MHCTERLYYAREVADLNGNGLTANMVGRIAKKHNLKTSTYGIWVQDEITTSPGNTRHVSVFKYNEAGLRAIRDIWNKRDN